MEREFEHRGGNKKATTKKRLRFLFYSAKVDIRHCHKRQAVSHSLPERGVMLMGKNQIVSILRLLLCVAFWLYIFSINAK